MNRYLGPNATVVAAEANTDWMADAACRTANTDMFFPTRGDSVDAALAVCAQCPVCSDCLDYAMAIPNTTGVWGGTSEEQRERMRRRRTRSRVL